MGKRTNLRRIPVTAKTSTTRSKTTDDFSVRLRKLREEKRIKRYILSQRCGLHSDAIRRYELGEAEPDVSSLIAIADFFEVSLDYLTGRADYR